MNFKVFAIINNSRQFYGFAETRAHAEELAEDVLNTYGWLDPEITTEIEENH